VVNPWQFSRTPRDSLVTIHRKQVALGASDNT
jgi:hypothetical protein